MSAYYNEIDPFAAAWLRNLIDAGEIAPGDVDERSIDDVQPADLVGYRQCHFFAGIGGWSLALRLAGWEDSGPDVWTGSCPCQPLSCAGQRQGHADRRHLWPAFYRLIAERRPPVVFGEQVASEDGREWFAGIRADLEVLGYACGGADLCAAWAGAPHLRQRLFWVADADGDRRHAEGVSIRRWRQVEATRLPGWGVETLRVSHAAEQRPRAQESSDSPKETDCRWPHDAPPNRRFTDSFGNSYRIPESGIPFLADGFPGILGQIRAAGNAIVPEVAAEVIRAYMEIAA